MRILWVLPLLFSALAFANDVKNCHGLLEPVFTKQAQYTLNIKQHGGSCYFEAAVGMIQDELIKRQIECDVSSDSFLYLARTTFIALHLASRVQRINRGEDIDLIDMGKADEVFQLVAGLDIPLVYRSSLQPGIVSNMVEEVFQQYYSLPWEEREQGADISNIKAYLQKQVDEMFSSSQSSNKFFRIKKLEHEVYFHKTAIPDWPKESLFKDMLGRHSKSLLVAITTPRGRKWDGGGIHILRIVGYQENRYGDIENIILENTAEDFRPPYEYGQNTMSYSEFRSRCIEITELLVDGEIIDKSEAQNIQL